MDCQASPRNYVKFRLTAATTAPTVADMATKKKSKETKEEREQRISREHDGWMRVIKQSGRNLQKRIDEVRDTNLLRAAAIKGFPLEDIFAEVATLTNGAPEMLRAMIADAKSGLRESPDALTVALVRGAYFWYRSTTSGELAHLRKVAEAARDTVEKSQDPMLKAALQDLDTYYKGTK